MLKNQTQQIVVTADNEKEYDYAGIDNRLVNEKQLGVEETRVLGISSMPNLDAKRPRAK